MLLAVLTKYDGAILGPIAIVLGWIFNGIYAFFSTFGIENAGFCIIVFTFIVNTLMIPMTMKQQKFTKLSSKMNPELTKIQEKYKGKKDEESLKRSQAETQAIYEKYGANPTSGCLPMLITLPIMFALYRVIYNIPAYVNGIRDLYDNIAVAMVNKTDYLSSMTEYANNFAILNVKKWGDISTEIPTTNLIDILAQFKAGNWEELLSNPVFNSIADVIAQNSEKIMKINNFGFGLNIAETPMGQFTASDVSIGVKIAYILIPVLSVVTQMIQTKLMTKSQPQTNSTDTASATMKSMNTIMPFFSGAICLTIPVGLGIYWIAGAVFRILQQLIIDKQLEKVDVDELIEKNREKQKNKKIRAGIDPNKSMEEFSKKRTSKIEEKANYNSKKNDNKTFDYKNESSRKANSDKIINDKENSSKVSNGKGNNAKEYKQGGIGQYANMLNRNQKEREEN